MNLHLFFPCGRTWSITKSLWQWIALGGAILSPLFVSSSVQAQPLTPQLVTEIRPGTDSANPHRMQAVGELLFFMADDGVHGYELWKADGTAAGTMMLKDIGPGTETADISRIVPFNSKAVFSANNEEQDFSEGRFGNYELWISDGTPEGTVMLKEINPTESALPGLLGSLGGNLYFTAIQAGSTRTLWKSDGTEAGTEMVPISGFAEVDTWYKLNETAALFYARDDQGMHLWHFDSTTEQITLLKTLITPELSGNIGNSLMQDDALYFAVSINGEESLWHSDGTAAGTAPIKSLVPAIPPFYRIYHLVKIGDTLYFSILDDSVTTSSTLGQLWKSDGTEAGTVKVMDICPYPLANVNETLIFRGAADCENYQLWRSDGTAAGTTLIKELNPNESGIPLEGFYVLNDIAYFRADDGASGLELWRSDGTEAGTALVNDLNPGPSSSLPPAASSAGFDRRLIQVGNLVYFVADSGATGLELWRMELPINLNNHLFLPTVLR